MMDYDGLFHFITFYISRSFVDSRTTPFLLARAGRKGRSWDYVRPLCAMGRRALGLLGVDETKSGGHKSCLHIYASGFRRGLSGSFCEPFSQGFASLYRRFWTRRMDREEMMGGRDDGIGGKRPFHAVQHEKVTFFSLLRKSSLETFCGRWRRRRRRHTFSTDTCSATALSAPTCRSVNINRQEQHSEAGTINNNDAFDGCRSTWSFFFHATP